MKDLKAERAKLLLEATDCEMIGSLAADAHKRATFRRVAQQLRQIADDLEAQIAASEEQDAA